MKLDKKYSYIFVCPETGEEIPEHSYFWFSGVCESCGNRFEGTIRHKHLMKLVGRWRRPSWFEWIFGSRKAFIINAVRSTK